MPRVAVARPRNCFAASSAGLLAVLLALATPAAAWGPEGHREIGEQAISSLPDPLKEFFETHSERFIDLLDDPARGRASARFFLERYDEFPFFDVPTTRELALRRFTEEEITQHGDALFELLEAWDALSAAFAEADYDLAMELASDVTWLVGEIGAPPNVSSVGDGQPTRQEGLARRFDTQLTDMFADDLRVRGSAALYLDRPHELHALAPAQGARVGGQHPLRDAQARRGTNDYGRFYMESVWAELGGLIDTLMSDASRDAASLVYTAWVEAGRPEVPDS